MYLVKYGTQAASAYLRTCRTRELYVLSLTLSVQWNMFRLKKQSVLGLKKIGVFPLTCRKKLGSVGRKIFLFFCKFLFNKIRSKMFLWITFH